MKVAVLKENRADERRVAASPETVRKMRGLGLDVVVESGAGAGASALGQTSSDRPGFFKARDIAEAREKKDREAALNKFKPVSLDSLSAAKTRAKITELKVILKVFSNTW